MSLCCLMVIASARAEPGDAEAVAKARKDYAEAMKSHDKGLQNAMKTELAFQLSKEKERKAAAKKHKPPARTAQPPSNGNPSS